MTYMHPTELGAPQATEQQRQPCIQIDADLWAAMRYPTDHPVAMIRLIFDQNQIPKYLVLNWHPEPHRRRLIAMYDTLKEANRSVLWEQVTPEDPDEMRHGPVYSKYPDFVPPQRS